jgi:hypothetical protein
MTDDKYSTTEAEAVKSARALLCEGYKTFA